MYDYNDNGQPSTTGAGRDSFEDEVAVEAWAWATAADDDPPWEL